jgi:hypothetical protein
MTELTDDDITSGVQNYWLVRIDGGSPYANVLDALGAAARARFEPDMYLLGGPYPGASVSPAQYWRVAVQLARNGKGVERERAAEALQIRSSRLS